MFDELWTAAQVIGLADSFPDGRFPAGIDPAGDLHIDPDGIAAMQRAFPTRPDPAFLARLERTRAERCRGLLDQVAAAEDAAGAGDAGALAAAVTRLLEAVAMVMPYPVLTKIVPGLLLPGNPAHPWSGAARLLVRLPGPPAGDPARRLATPGSRGGGGGPVVLP